MPIGRGSVFNARRSTRILFSALLIITLSFGLAILVEARPPQQTPEEGKTLFEQKCTSCHTIGSGKLVGPDLKGVTTRREPQWLARWIREPDKVLAAGDPIATQLLKEYSNIPMPNLALTDPQVEALIAYLKTAESPAAATPMALPDLYVPTLVAAVVVLAALTALRLGMARKQVEVRP